MPRDIKLPALGENVAEGDVVDIRVKPGDEVTEGQALIEVEAEKSSVEVPAPFAGKVEKVLVSKGDKVKQGQVVVQLAGEGESAESAQKSPEKDGESPDEHPPEKPAEKKSTEKKPAERQANSAAADDTDAETSDKSSQADKDVKEGEVVDDEEPVAKPATTKKTTAQPAATEGHRGVVPAGPATRRLANEWGVDLSRVAGSGVKGRVTRDDVKDYVKQLTTNGYQPAVTATAPPLPNFEQWGKVDYQPLDGVRRRTAQHMAVCWSQIPHVTHHDVADITDIEAFRKQQKDTKGPRVTVTAFALKACAIALKEFPQFNSSLDLAEDQLILKRYIHLGVAVDTDRGLLVPVVRDADKKSVQEISAEMATLAEKARDKKLSADDMKGGTFTISNLGGIGGVAFTPIVNYPEVAILGMSRSRWEPVLQDGNFVPRFRLPLSLSYDHRVIDGADAARFTRRLAQLLESPFLMLLHA